MRIQRWQLCQFCTFLKNPIKIKGAAHKNRDVENTCKRSLKYEFKIIAVGTFMSIEFMSNPLV